MSESSLMYWNDQLGKVAPRVLRLQYDITGAKTSASVVANTAQLTAYDAIASQSTIDTLLGTTNEFLIAAFDATAMGTDAFACIVNLNGQCRKLLGCQVKTVSGTGGGTVVSRDVSASATLTASSLSTQCALGASGNIAVRAVVTGLDALTSGRIEVDFYWISK